MTNVSQAEKIIENLLKDPELYQKKSEREGEVWGRIFSDDNFIELTKRDQKAAAKLKLNRHHLTLINLLKKHSIAPDFGLSLACGSGRAERLILKQGICNKFQGIDIAAGALEEARRIALKQNLDINYKQGDLNNIKLPRNTYDLVITQNCLHHVLQLEHIAEEIANSMTSNGVLWIQDYVGETQFQYTDERLYWTNKILSLLPERMVTNKLNGKVTREVVRPEPGRLVSPFESIRSAEIIPIFLERFDVIEKAEFNSILRLILPRGAKEEYLKNEESRALFEILVLIDNLLIEKQILAPTGCQYLLKPKEK